MQDIRKFEDKNHVTLIKYRNMKRRLKQYLDKSTKFMFRKLFNV